MIIRNSEVSEYQRCRLRWDYRWNRKLEPKKKSTKLVLGNLFHKFLECYYAPAENYTPEKHLGYGLYNMKAMYETDVVAKIEEGTYDPIEASDMWNLVEGLAHWYHEYWSKTQVNAWEVIATEGTYYINMRTLEWTTDRNKAEVEWDADIVYECTLDLVLRINGRLYIADHKTTKQLETFIKATEMDRQISRYLFAANVIFREEIGGLIYNLIKKEVPHEPNELKNGGLSVAKDQRTTHTMYMNKLIDKGLATYDEANDTWIIPEKYEETLGLLKQRELPNGQGNDFLRRVVVPRNKAEMNNAMNELMQVATAIRNMRNFLAKNEGKDLGFSNPVYRNITKDCSWDCGFRACCVAGMDGTDVKFLEEELLEPIKNHYESDGVDE